MPISSFGPRKLLLGFLLWAYLSLAVGNNKSKPKQYLLAGPNIKPHRRRRLPQSTTLPFPFTTHHFYPPSNSISGGPNLTSFAVANVNFQSPLSIASLSPHLLQSNHRNCQKRRGKVARYTNLIYSLEWISELFCEGLQVSVDEFRLQMIIVYNLCCLYYA